MSDPVKRTAWNKKYYVYAEKHALYDVVQNLMKELAIWRPEDPLLYIKSEIKRIGHGIYAPKVFMIGPEPLTPILAEGISNHCEAKFLTLKSLIENTIPDIRTKLSYFLRGEDTDDEQLRKLLIGTISRRLVAPDCVKCGYVLYGFPQSRAQALMAQSSGLLPKQVFVLMPQGPPDSHRPSSKTLSPTATATANPGHFTDLFAAQKLNPRFTSKDFSTWQDFFAMKDTATAYNSEVLRVQCYENWSTSDPHDLEAEFLGVLVTKQRTGAPWIPRIVILGPPASGKRTVAEKLATKFGITAFNWIEIIRGALALEDGYSDECKMYLDNFTPLSDECVTALLTRRLYRDDCIKKGYVLYGFPETVNQAIVLDKVALSPNRVLLLSCPAELCQKRIDEKKMEIMSRRMPNHPMFYTNPNILEIGGEQEAEAKETFRQNPYSNEAINAQFEYYNHNLPGVLTHYGSNIINVDTSLELTDTINYVLASTIRPPNIVFNCSEAEATPIDEKKRCIERIKMN